MKAEPHKRLYRGGFCLVTDRRACGLTCVEMAGMALEAGVRWIQYRDKDRCRLSCFRTALRLRDLTARYGAFFIVNDFADIAASVEADGVHLGQDDLPVGEARKILGRGRVIGVSTHSLSEALRAEAEGADYIGFGPVFRTRTKASAGAPRGVEMLTKVKTRVAVPVVAIGGIGGESLEEVFTCGADAVAAASSVLAGDIRLNASCLMDILSRLDRAAGG